LVFALTSSAFPQDNGHELAKKLANPISSLISVPFSGLDLVRRVTSKLSTHNEIKVLEIGTLLWNERVINGCQARTYIW
jgi:hypothetical protein